MKVLYDHQAFTMQYFGGVSKCFCELIRHRPSDMAYDIAVKTTGNVHLIRSGIKENILPLKLDYHSFSRKYPLIAKHKIYNFLNGIGIIKGAEYINKEESINKIVSGNFDVFHATFFDDYFLSYLTDKPFVITIHDMMPELFPQFFPSPNPETVRKKKLCEKASAIIAVSENTKQDLVRIMGIPEDKIYVVYHGGPDFKTINKPSLIKHNYFLFVGQRDAYKNFECTLRDFASFSNKYQDVFWVFTGKPFTDRERLLINNLKLRDKIIYCSPTDEDLLNLYKYAIGFVYPSLYEGFGMPILEAYACGCPVLLNKKSCFPEIAQNAAIYFDSDGINSNLADQMELLYLMSSQERSTLINKQNERLAHFSWTQSAQKLYTIYSTIIQHV